MLDAFQSAAKEVALQEVGDPGPAVSLLSVHREFPRHGGQEDHRPGQDNASLEHRSTSNLLQVLFLIRYVEEMKGNVDNLVTLCIDQIDADRLALRGKIEESLARLEKETLISRSGDVYFFLTNEERDINKEIKAVELSSGEEAKLLGEIIFNDVLKEQRKHRYPVNKMDFTFNRLCDLTPIGNQIDGALLVSVITPLNDDYESYEKAKCILESSGEGGHVIIRSATTRALAGNYAPISKPRNTSVTRTTARSPNRQSASCGSFSEDNQERRKSLAILLGDMLADANYYAAGQKLKLKATAAMAALNEALEYLVQNTFTKMGYLKVLCQEPLKEVQAILRSNDIGTQTLALKSEEGNKQAMDDVRNYVALWPRRAGRSFCTT